MKRPFFFIFMTICLLSGFCGSISAQPVLKGKPGDIVRVTFKGENLRQIVNIEEVRFDDEKIDFYDPIIKSDTTISVQIHFPYGAKEGSHRVKLSVLLAGQETPTWLQPTTDSEDATIVQYQAPEVDIFYDGNLVKKGDTLTIGFVENPEGDFVSKIISFRNPGRVSRALNNFNLPPELLLIGTLPDSIPPEEDFAFQLQLSSEAPDSFNKSLQFYINENPITLQIEGKAIPTISASTQGISDTLQRMVISFDSSNVWSENGKSLLLRNAGSDTLIVSEVQLPKGFIFSDSLPKRIPAGDSAIVQIQLDDSLRNTFEGTLQFQINNTDGQGDYQIAAYAVPAPIPGIYISDGVHPITSGQSFPVDFGTTSPGSPLSKTLMIRNTGNTTLLLSNLQLPSGFTLSGSFPDSIEAGETANCTIEFSPDSAQSLSGEVQFATNIRGNNLISFPVIGTTQTVADTRVVPPEPPSNSLTKIFTILALLAGVGGAYLLIRVPIRKYWMKKISSTKPTFEFKPERDSGSQQIEHSADIKFGFEVRVKPVLDNGSQNVKIKEILLLVDHSQSQSEQQKPDDLTRIEGIGPKIAEIFREAGITTFAQLAKTEINRLNQILHDAGIVGIADPKTWPEQAKLAAAGKWQELDALQKELKGGRIAIQ